MTHPTRWDAGHYRQRHAFVFENSLDLVDHWLAPQPGEQILDLGCGSGELSAHIAAQGAAVLGLDASPEMIAAARSSHPEVRFQVADARELDGPARFDAVFSNAALHWMHPLDRVLAGVGAALRPGGRLALEMGGAGNVQVTLDAVRHALARLNLPDLPHPWTFPTTAALAVLLEQAGLRVERAHWFPRPSLLAGEDGFRAWLTGFGSGWLAPLSPEQRAAVLEEAKRYARPFLWTGEGWSSDYCRLRALAVRP